MHGIHDTQKSLLGVCGRYYRSSFDGFAVRERGPRCAAVFDYQLSDFGAGADFAASVRDRSRQGLGQRARTAFDKVWAARGARVERSSRQQHGS